VTALDPGAITVADLERDPYPIYAALRAEHPVAYVPALDVWMVTRWADVEAACQDPVSFPAHVVPSPTHRALGGVSMMTTDGEPARRRRRPFDASLRPRAVEATMPEVIRRLCERRLDALRPDADGSVDLVRAYFEPVSVRTLAIALGIADVVDDATLVRWFAGLAAGVSNYEDDPAKTAACAAVSDEIDALVGPLLTARLADPADDGLFDQLITAGEGSPEERLAFVMPSFKLVLLGGLQEPAHGGATITHCLLADGDALRAVRADPGLIPAAVDEGLRWTAPIGNLLRGVRPGTTMAGVTFPPGARAILVVSSANRDRAEWGDDADRFVLGRPRRPSLAFATGPHYCIGHHLARVQLRIAVATLLARFPALRLDPDRPVVYHGHEYRSPRALPVRLD
jgi:cytochrome P450